MSASAKPTHRFALLTFSGLGEVAAGELGLSRDNYEIKQLRNQDLVICAPAERALETIPRLRSVEDVFVLLGKPVTVEATRDLKHLNHNLYAGPILDALNLKNRLFSPDKPRRVTFNCFVKQDQDRKVQRRQIEAAAVSAIARAFPKWRIADPASIEVWAFYIRQKVWLGFRLTSHSMRYHGREPAKRQGALRPTIAGAMTTIAALRPSELVLDPMCGSGSILREARVAGSQVLGGDIDTMAVSRCRSSGISVALWDAVYLPLGDAVVDCVICNLPFGRQYSSEDDLESLYLGCVTEWKRVLRPSGRMVLLTSQAALLKRVLKDLGLFLTSSRKTKVLGVWATIYSVSVHA